MTRSDSFIRDAAGMTTTTGTFDLTSWNEEPYDEADGARLVRAGATKTFSGGLQGTGAVQMLQALTPGGSAVYVAIERVTAMLADRSGSFVLRHCALSTADGAELRIDVVPGSATDELAGLRGEMDVVVEPDGVHRYRFDYRLS